MLALTLLALLSSCASADTPESTEVERLGESSQADTLTNLAAWLKIDESSGAAADSAGSNAGILHAGASFAPSGGKLGGAVSLDGQVGFVDYGSSSALNFAFNAPFTVAAWVKTTDSYGMIVSQRNSNEGGAVLDLAVGYDGVEFRPGHVMAIVRQDGGAGGYAHVYGGLVNDNQWHHVAVVRSGSTITLYRDGVSQGSASGAESRGSITTNRRRIGSDQQWSNDGYFQPYDKLSGLVDDVRIYTRALPASDIVELHAVEPTSCGGSPCFTFPINTPTSLSGSSIKPEFPTDTGAWIAAVRHMGDAGSSYLTGEVANPITWDVGQYTGLAIGPGSRSAYQRGYSDVVNYNAFQAIGGSFGSFIHTSSFPHSNPVVGGGPHSILTYQFPPGGYQSIYNHATSVLAVQADVEVPYAAISDPAAHGELSLEFQLQDSASHGVLDFVAKIFDTRPAHTGTSNSDQETSYEHTGWNGSPLGIVYVPMKAGTTYGHTSPFSQHMVNTTPFAASSMYRFEVSQSELTNAIAAVNAKRASQGHSANFFSSTPSNYKVIEVGVLHEVFVCVPGCAHEVMMGTSAHAPYLMELW